MLNTLYTSDVRHTLDHFRRSVDQLFESFAPTAERTAPARPSEQEWTFSPVIESAWTENELHLRAVVPGVRQNDVNVNLQGNLLLISGERRLPENFGRRAYTQLQYGKFSTSVTLPNTLQFDAIRCELHDGVLDIAIPIAESMKPRQIPVQISSGQKAIGA